MRAHVRSPVTLTRGNGERVYYTQGWCEIAEGDEKNDYLMAFVDEVEAPVSQQKQTDSLPDIDPPKSGNGGEAGGAGDSLETSLGDKDQKKNGGKGK